MLAREQTGQLGCSSTLLRIHHPSEADGQPPPGPSRRHLAQARSTPEVECHSDAGQEPWPVHVRRGQACGPWRMWAAGWTSSGKKRGTCVHRSPMQPRLMKQPVTPKTTTPASPPPPLPTRPPRSASTIPIAMGPNRTTSESDGDVPEGATVDSGPERPAVHGHGVNRRGIEEEQFRPFRPERSRSGGCATGMKIRCSRVWPDATASVDLIPFGGFGRWRRAIGWPRLETFTSRRRRVRSAAVRGQSRALRNPSTHCCGYPPVHSDIGDRRLCSRSNRCPPRH